MSWASENRPWLDRARRVWSPDTTEPLLLRAWLAAPVAYDGYDAITIDGALQSAVCLRETGRLPDDVYSECPLSASLEETDIQIPITDSVMSGIPIAHVSIGWFSPDATATKRQNWKRARAENYARDVVKTSEASTKTQMVLKQTVAAMHLDFYAQGDRAKLSELLTDVSHLGAGRSGGLGDLLGWEVLPAPGAWWFEGPDRRLMRSLPADRDAAGATGYDERIATLRAPYWHQRTRRLCHVPVQRLGETLAVGEVTGRFFVTPHAVERYRERIPGKRGLSYEQALGELIRLLDRAHRVRVDDNGTELWRVGNPTRLRFRVQPSSLGLPQVLTVMMPFDRKPEARV